MVIKVIGNLCVFNAKVLTGISVTENGICPSTECNNVFELKGGCLDMN